MAFRTSAASLVLAVLIQKCQSTATPTPFFATDADSFLGQVVASRACVHSDIEAALQNSAFKEETDEGVEADLRKVEDRLRPIYHALPKTKHDRLSSAAVRYLLHRHFVHYRAWLVKGVAPDGKAWGEDFPMDTFAAWAPDGIQTVVADHLNGRGLTLRECAVMATLLENQVHAEAIRILSSVWKVHGLKLGDRVADNVMNKIVEDFLLYYLYLRVYKEEMSEDKFADARRSAETGFPHWPETQKFLWEVQQRVAWGATTDGLSFSTGEQIIMRLIQQWGGKQVAGYCRTLKRDLLGMEGKRPGRVDLNVFHASAAFQHREDFVETAAYLRELGVLDESDPSKPEVVIPNYVASPANFIATGDLFAIACVDDCENLLGHIERRAGGPTATPEHIADIVSTLPTLESEKVAVSDELMQHLRQVAALHGGRVPLHGRLFALWMHHAYPRDCQYPAQGGTTKQRLPLDYEAATGLSSFETDEELEHDYVAAKSSNNSEKSTTVSPLPWDLQEELLQEPIPDDSLLRLTVAAAAIFAAVSAGTAAVRVQQPQGRRSAAKVA